MPCMNALFLLLLGVYDAVYSASKGVSDAVFGSFYAVHECTFPHLICIWCSFIVLQMGRSVQFFRFPMTCMNALFLLFLFVYGAVL